MPFQFRKEAIEEDLNSNFPSQGQGNPPLYYSLSEVVVPTYSINSVAEGSGLPENLQTAWDFSTGSASRTASGTTTLINNTGFWLVDVSASIKTVVSSAETAVIRINDGVTTKPVWGTTTITAGSATAGTTVLEQKFVVFLRSGDSLELNISATNFFVVDAWYRQIADLNGTLINPLGFSFA